MNDKKETVTKKCILETSTGNFQIPGFGVVPIGINELQDSGVKFVVCNAAMTVYSAVWAMQNNAKAEDVKKDWNRAYCLNNSCSIWCLGLRPCTGKIKCLLQCFSGVRKNFFWQCRLFSLHFLFCNRD
jgi:hypothetical protein